MRESKIEKEITKYARSLNWSVYKFVSPGCKGVPDRLFIKAGVVIFIEFKAPNKIPSKLQFKRLKQLKNQGFIAKYIDNIQYGIKLFNLFEKLYKL